MAQLLPVGKKPFEAPAARLGQVVQDAEVPTGAAQLRSVIKGDGVKAASSRHFRCGQARHCPGKRQPAGHGALKEVLEDVVLGLEVVIQRGLPDPHGIGDGAGGGVGEPLGGEELSSSIQDLLPGGGPWPGGLLAARASRSG
jgi:hypothetical protein